MQYVTYVTPNTQELWDDTLMMTVMPLARIGKLLGRPQYIEEAKKQFLVRITYLSIHQPGSSSTVGSSMRAHLEKSGIILQELSGREETAGSRLRYQTSLSYSTSRRANLYDNIYPMFSKRNVRLYADCRTKMGFGEHY
jgi:hypothetical protein